MTDPDDDAPRDKSRETAEGRAPRARVETALVGIVVRRKRGATRWAAWVWSVPTLLMGAGPATGKVLSEDPQTGAQDVHAATLELELHRADVEGYQVALDMTPPSFFVVLRRGAEDDDADVAAPIPFRITASAHEAQDFCDGDDEIVEAVAAPPALVAWVADFVEYHWKGEPFKKRRRDRYQEPRQDGVGDARVRQTADVYRAPAALKPKRTRSNGGLNGAGDGA